MWRMTLAAVEAVGGGGDVLMWAMHLISFSILSKSFALGDCAVLTWALGEVLRQKRIHVRYGGK